MKQVLVECVQQQGRLLHHYPCTPLALSSSNPSTSTDTAKPAGEAGTGGPVQQQ